MTSLEGRLARVEERTRVAEERLDELLELVSSGPRVPWDQSIRGRLHKMQNTLATADKLAEAAREVRRARTSQLTGLERGLLVVCAIVAAATPYVILLTR